MSKEIAEIKGEYEFVADTLRRKVAYGEATIKVISFSGGKRGQMAGIFIEEGDGGHAHVQLTLTQVRELIAQMREVFE